MRVPFIMRWPGRVPAGAVCDALATSMDLMPTLAKLAGTSPPTDRIIDGKDVWPLMSGESGAQSPHDRFYYYYMGSLEAVRSGRWKLHLGFQPIGRYETDFPASIELYDLEVDSGETTNVADRHPAVVQRLQALAEQARKDLGDAQTKTVGGNTRPSGWVEMPTTLTHR